jgi:hypothetical protein
MMKAEFEKLAGYEVSNEDYNKIIEPMYMATDLSKEEFVKVIDKKRFALKTKEQYIAEMKKIAKHLYDTCSQYYDSESREKLKALADEYTARFYNEIANNMFNSVEKTYTGCYYPETVEIYGIKEYNTIEIIKLV